MTKLAHEFIPNPWPLHAHKCDARVDNGDGQVRPCLRPKEEHQGQDAADEHVPRMPISSAPEDGDEPPRAA